MNLPRIDLSRLRRLRLDWTGLARLPRALEVGLALLLLWQLAGLFWQIAAPRAGHGNLAMPAAIPPAPRYAPQGLQGWFAPSTEDAATVPSDLSLLAVVSGQRGVALLRWGQASSVAARVGDEFRPGSRLVAVMASGIVVEQGGVRSTVALPRSASGTASIQVVAAPVAPAAVPAPAPAPTLKPAATLSRGQLSGGIQGSNLAGWDKGIASYRDGGIVIDDVARQPLLQALQLRNGDVLKGINGREIKQLADISLLYNQISQQAALDLSVLRDGALQTLTYKIQP